MNRLLIPVAFALVATAGLQAQESALDTEAKFVKVLLASTGQFGFACNEPGLKAKLESLGVSVGPGFKLAWAMSQSEVRALKAQGRFIVCAEAAWLKDGAALAIVNEGGKPQLYMDSANVKASGVTLADSIARIARKS